MLPNAGGFEKVHEKTSFDAATLVYRINPVDTPTRQWWFGAGKSEQHTRHDVVEAPDDLVLPHAQDAPAFLPERTCVPAVPSDGARQFRGPELASGSRSRIVGWTPVPLASIHEYS